MPSIRVHPEDLGVAGQEQAALAHRILELSSRLQQAASSAAAAVGEPAAAGAVSDFGATWAVSLEGLAESVGVLGTNLGSAAWAYVQTDEGVVPSPGR